MANLNKVMLIGRLTRDPEVRAFFPLTTQRAVPHREAVSYAMTHVEDDMLTRLRSDGRDEDRRTGNMIAMRVTQDAIPGVRIPLHFTPTKVGVYQINCAQLCGKATSNRAMGKRKSDRA